MTIKYLAVLLLLTSFLIDPPRAIAQCSIGLDLVKKEVNSKGEGHLKIEVNASGIFSGKLIESNGDSELSTEKFSGDGNDVFSFKHLNSNPEHSYKVEVDFLSEEKFLCKKRVLVDIHFSDN
jgi:hypothetical protein